MIGPEDDGRQAAAAARAQRGGERAVGVRGDYKAVAGGAVGYLPAPGRALLAGLLAPRGWSMRALAARGTLWQRAGPPRRARGSCGQRARTHQEHPHAAAFLTSAVRGARGRGRRGALVRQGPRQQRGAQLQQQLPAIRAEVVAEAQPRARHGASCGRVLSTARAEVRPTHALSVLPLQRFQS